MKTFPLGAALAAAVLVPAAAAAGNANVRLALVPLPKSSLGAAAGHLPIAHDSGPVSDAEAAGNASDVTPEQLQRLGRAGGYLLDYGNLFGAGAGVREIQTEADRYRSAADARRGFAFWRRQELKAPPLASIHFSVRKLHLSGLPKPSWAYAETVSVEGLKPVRGIDAEIRQGPYLLDVSVAAGSTAAAARLVPQVARRLDGRLRRALAGRLHAHPVSLPPPLVPGPPPHGARPAALVLKTADLGKGARVLHKGYGKPKSSLDENALSVYDVTMAAQGSFPVLSQEVLVGSSKLEARYFAAIVLGAGLGSGKGVKSTPVDLGGVGDDARGEIAQTSAGGASVTEAVVVLTRGPYLDFVVEASPSGFDAASVRSLARLAAKRLDAGFR